MAIYADTDNLYLTDVFFLLCDDMEREQKKLLRSARNMDGKQFL